MKSAAIIGRHERHLHEHHLALPRGWAILGLAVVAWAGVFFAGSGIVTLWQVMSGAI